MADSTARLGRDIRGGGVRGGVSSLRSGIALELAEELKDDGDSDEDAM